MIFCCIFKNNDIKKAKGMNMNLWPTHFHENKKDNSPVPAVPVLVSLPPPLLFLLLSSASSSPPLIFRWWGGRRWWRRILPPPPLLFPLRLFRRLRRFGRRSAQSAPELLVDQTGDRFGQFQGRDGGGCRRGSSGCLRGTCWLFVFRFQFLPLIIENSFWVRRRVVFLLFL